MTGSTPSKPRAAGSDDEATLKGEVAAAEPMKESAAPPASPTTKAERLREIGGPKGPEPTRYGDWEKGGRCSDF